MIPVLVTAFAATLLAEVVGDKTLYTTGALAGAHRPGPVVVGASLAAGVKMGVAVLAGGLLTGLPSWLLLTLGVLTWLGAAGSLWRRPVAPIASGRLGGQAFLTVLLTEWADPGQLMAATVAAGSHKPLLTWVGATAAMVVKIAVGAGLVGVLRRWIAPERLRVAGVAAFVLFALLAGIGVR